MDKNIESILEHLEFHHFVVNHELSDEESIVLDNPLSERRIEVSATDYIVRVSMFYSFELGQYLVTPEKLNELNSNLSVCKAVGTDTEERNFIALNSLFILPYNKESFNTFWALFVSDADDFDRMIADCTND